MRRSGLTNTVFGPHDFVIYIDETGHEEFADPRFPVFGFGGVAVVAAELDTSIGTPWRHLRRVIRGSEDLPLHASELSPNEIRDHASKIGGFFEKGNFARFGVSCSDATISLASMEASEYILAALGHRILHVMGNTIYPNVRIIFEESERTDNIVQKYFGNFRVIDDSHEVPLHFYFMPKISMDPALEVADFIAHAIGRHAHPMRRAGDTYGRDFGSIFHDQEPQRVSYMHIKNVKLNRDSKSPEHHPGSCHCGAISVALTASRPLSDLPIRRCDCSFCRRHGARTVSDPGGELVIRAPAGALNRYRFGLRITDMLICATCGVYVAALISHEGRDYATLNANMLDARDSLNPAPPLASYGGETAEARIARRLAKWTPTRLEIADG